MHKINSQFPDKYDIKSFELATVLILAPRNVYQNRQSHIFD